MKKSSNGPRKAKKAARMVVRQIDDYHLPQLSIAMSQRETLRWQLKAAVSGNITAANILDSVAIAASSTSLYQFHEFFRIRRIRAWCMGDGTIPVTLAIFLPGPQAYDGQYKTDTSMSVSPAHLDIVPNDKGLVSFWQVSSTNVMLQVTLPINTIIELVLDWKTQYGGTAVACSAAGSGATTGCVYRRGLDGTALAATNYVPAVPSGGAQ
jgi:hypothetical protein